MNNYQKLAHETSIPICEYRLNPNQTYAAVGLSNEAGEVLGVVKKAIRGDFGDHPVKNGEFRMRMADELGDVAWYLAECCTQFGFSLDDIMDENIEKLRKRAKNGTIMGSGDDR